MGIPLFFEKTGPSQPSIGGSYLGDYNKHLERYAILFIYR